MPDRVKRFLIAGLMAVLLLNIWTGGPLLALWIGSRVQGEGPPTMGAVAVVLLALGVICSALYRGSRSPSQAYDELTGPLRPSATARSLASQHARRAPRIRRGAARVAPRRADSSCGGVLAFAASRSWFFFFSGSSDRRRLSAGGEQPGELVLARHGETEWSSDRAPHRPHRCSADRGGPAAGEAARGLARRQATEFERVLSSPLSRALETCRLAGFGDAAETAGRTARVGLRGVRGAHHARDPRAASGLVALARRLPGRASGATDVGGRADRAARRAARRSAGDVALFAHGHVLRVLAARWIGLPAAGRRAAWHSPPPPFPRSAGSARPLW